MRTRPLLMLAALFGASPALAATLAHPDNPIFNACAVDMNVNGETIADRILTVGWMEAALTTDLQNLGRDHMELSNFGPSVFFGKTSKEDWDTSFAELSDVRDLDPYESGQVAGSDTVRAFADPDGSGFAVVSSDPDGFWTCEILMTVAPVGAARFMSDPPSNGDRVSTGGITYMSDERPLSDLADFAVFVPFLPPPKHYYSEFVLAEPDIIEERFGHSVKLVFAASFYKVYPF